MASETTLRYLKLDYQSHKDALLQRVRARWPQVWNDFLTSSFGIVIVDIVAWALATLAFVINRGAAEQFIPTMTLRESAVRLGALPGYQLRNPQPASVACEAELTTAQEAQVVIQKGLVIRTSDSEAIAFEVAKDYVIEAGQLTPHETVVRINANLVGANVLATFVAVTNGSVNVDLADSTINLSEFIQAGQSFQVDGEDDVYAIEAVESAPGAVSLNRIVLATAYAGSTASGLTCEIFDRRIQLIQGQTITDQFVSPSIQTLSWSVKLSQTPVIDNSIEVTVNNQSWSKVSNIAQASAEDAIFQVRTFASGQTIVTFGDGTFGRAIPTEAVVVVAYRIGGGSDGNVARNSFVTSVTGTITSTANPVTVNITNATATGVGGRDAETLDEARMNIPYFIKTNDRAVTLADYQTLASQFVSPYGSVAFARSAVRTENAFLEGNIVVIYAWTTGASGGLVPLSAQLKVALKDYLQTKSVGTDFVEVFDGTERPVPVSLRFRVFAGFDVKDTERLVEDTLANFVNILRPGDPVIYSNLLRKLDEVYGVDTINMATPISDLIPSNSTELFTRPQAGFVYDIERTGVGTQVTTTDDGQIGLYLAQLPVFPVQPWSFRLFLGTNELTVLPGADAGFAELYGQNLSTSQDESDSAVALFDPEPSINFKSTVNLLTGQARLWLKGAPGDLTMKLNPVDGYSTDHAINVYIGYSGENTPTKRSEIRSALRAWAAGLSIGGAIYAEEVSGVTVSKSNVKAVVSNVPGVTAVNRIALDTPGNIDVSVHATDFELLKLGSIVLNSKVD